MPARLVQGLIMVVVVTVLAVAVLANADGWADWVVFGVLLVTTFGFAVAIAPSLYARRRRTISREGGGGGGGISRGG